MATTSVTIRMDENLKKQAEAIFEEMGLNMTTAITVFVKAVVRQRKIPFEIAADPFYTVTRQTRPRQMVTDQEADSERVYELLEEDDE